MGEGIKSTKPNRNKESYMKRTMKKMLTVLAVATVAGAPGAQAQSTTADITISPQSLQMIADVRASFDRFVEYVRVDSLMRAAAAESAAAVATGLNNPFRAMIEQADALKLTDAQLDAIAVLNYEYTLAADAELRAVRQRFESAARELLTPQQLQSVSAELAKILSMDAPRR
jgi:hypothetical protein